MKFSLVLTFLVVGLGAVVYSRTIGLIRYDSTELFTIRKHLPNDKMDKFHTFVGFMKKYDKQYKNTVEVKERFENFVENLERIPKSQANEQGSAIHGVTQFFDMTFNEWKQTFTGAKLTHKKRLTGKHDLSSVELLKYQNVEVPTAVDWRTKGAVTPIKNQGACGSCFSFGAIGAVEGQWFKKTGKLIAFSEEEVLDCGDAQCGGGDPLHVYDTIAEIGGLQTEETYPYVAGEKGTGDCKSNDKQFVAYVNGSRALPTEDEELLAKILAVEGPIEINIDADWLFDYEKGIIDSKDQEPGPHVDSINHAVLLVGYGIDQGVPFWNIKNSWGEHFGEQGYFRVKRGSDRLYLVDSNPSLPLIY